MQNDNTITAKILSGQLGVSNKTIKRDIASLKERGIIERQGSDNTGTWVITARQTREKNNQSPFPS